MSKAISVGMHFQREVDIQLVKLIEDRRPALGEIVEALLPEIPDRSAERRKMLCQMLEPVKPFTTAGNAGLRAASASINFRAALAVSIIFFAARLRTPSGSPSPQTSGGRIGLCRSSMRSHTAWPTRWAEMAKSSARDLRGSSIALAVVLVLQRAIDFEMIAPAGELHAVVAEAFGLGADLSNERSAHWPVNRVTGLAMIYLRGGIGF